MEGSWTQGPGAEVKTWKVGEPVDKERILNAMFWGVFPHLPSKMPCGMPLIPEDRILRIAKILREDIDDAEPEPEDADWRARAEQAEARVAELEAQVATQQAQQKAQVATQKAAQEAQVAAQEAAQKAES